MTSFTFYAKTHTANVNGVQAIDYRTQTQDVLTALDMQMGTRTNLTKKSLTRVSACINLLNRLLFELQGASLHILLLFLSSCAAACLHVWPACWLASPRMVLGVATWPPPVHSWMCVHGLPACCWFACTHCLFNMHGSS